MLIRRTFIFAFVALLTILIASPSQAAQEAKHEHHSHTSKQVSLEELEKRPKTKLKVAKNETLLYVSDLHCKHCAKNISTKLYKVKGVVKVRTDLKADVAVVTPQSKKKIDPLALWAAAKKSGFPAIKLVGPDGTYVLDAKTKEPTLLPEKTTLPKS